MNTKRSAQAELVHMDLQSIIAEMNRYSARRLQNVDIKQLEGKTPDDFSSDVILKVLEGTRDWQTAATDDFKKFLFGCLRSEINHFLEKIGRRGISIVEIMEDKFDFENESGITYAEPHPFRSADLMLDQNNDADFHPKGYNNLDDEQAYNTEKLLGEL